MDFNCLQNQSHCRHPLGLEKINIKMYERTDCSFKLSVQLQKFIKNLLKIENFLCYWKFKPHLQREHTLIVYLHLSRSICF